MRLPSVRFGFVVMAVLSAQLLLGCQGEPTLPDEVPATPSTPEPTAQPPVPTTGLPPLVPLPPQPLEPEPGRRPAAAFWPLPKAQAQTYWWNYRWSNGGYYSHANPSACPVDPLAPPTAGIAASYLNDGAFGGQDLLSISFFKDKPCTYWFPTKNFILRWYSVGMKRSNTTIQDTREPGNFVDQFLSFRGHSAWVRDENVSVNFWGPAGDMRHRVKGGYAWPKVGALDAFDSGLKYSYVSVKDPSVMRDDAQFPNYGVLPDRMVTANVVLSSDLASNEPPNTFTTFARHCKYQLGGNASWRQLQQDTCPALSQSAWGLFMRTTTATFQGKPVLYVGYSEPWGTGGVAPAGACEEWWYAQDIGPIAIREWKPSSLEECKELLQGTHPGADINDYTSMPSWDNDRLRGKLTLTEFCVRDGCRVGYHGEDYANSR